MKATIALSIIVKDESNVILTMLNSVYKLLDYYVVVDTGSTDNTKEIIKNFFDEKGIPGEIIDHEWKNYGDARNVALDAIKGKADFGFWIDADDEFIIDSNFNINEFKTNLINYDGIICNYYRNKSNYKNMPFFSIKKNFKWIGALHEILYCDNYYNLNFYTDNNIKIYQYKTGNSWSNVTEKWKKYLILIEDFVKTTDKNHILYPRWIFYLAQTYYDNKNYAKALQTYEQRVNLKNGYGNDEVYISLLKIAELKTILKYDILDIINSYLKCSEETQERIEHIIPIIEYYNSIEKYNIAYIYSSYAMKYAGKHPLNSYVMINFSIYDWRIYDLHNISSWWSGHVDEAKETFKILLEQLEKGLVDENEIDRIIYNKQFNI